MSIPQDRMAPYIIAGLVALLDRYVSPINRINVFDPRELKALAVLGEEYLSATEKQDVPRPIYHRCESCLCAFGVATASPICSPCFFASPS